MLVQRSERSLRLDNDASPAFQIECEGNVVGDRMAAPDINVEATTASIEDAVEMIVLEPLSVGELHRIRPGQSWTA
jgi:hypothetical protein